MPRQATPLTLPMLLARTMPVPESGCHIWMGSTNNHGYGTVHIGGRNGTVAFAHRLAYALSQGTTLADLPSGLCVKHACDTPPCINPAHLSLGTWRDNNHETIARHKHPVAFMDGKCRAGHDLAVTGIYEFTPQNRPRYRICRACRRASYLRWLHTRNLKRK